MSVEPNKKRQFDLKEGTRSYVLGIRCSKPEMLYIEKIAKKMKISRSAVVMSYFSAHKAQID